MKYKNPKSQISQVKSEDPAPYNGRIISKMDSLIEKLENYRLEHKIPQQELAEKLGVAFSTVNRWLNGKSVPNKIQSYHIEKLLKSK